MQLRNVVRTLYLYLFALVGLILLAIGGVRLADMALRATVFTAADQEERIRSRMPPQPPVPARIGGGAEVALSAEEREWLAQWRRDYERWEEELRSIDSVTARRHREASSGLAMILIGLPLYLYHWRLIRRESATG